MAPRADALAELRALDRRLSAVAPGAHLERRILAKLRGEEEEGRGLGWARRPALVLSFALAAAVAVLLGIEARGVTTNTKGRPSAAGPSAPEGRDFNEAAPAADSAEPSEAPAAPAINEDDTRKPARSPDAEERPRRRAPNREVLPHLRERVRPKTPRWLNAPDAPDGYEPPSAPEGGRRPSIQSPSRAPGQSPSASYYPMVHPQGAWSEAPEPRSIRLSGPRRPSAAGTGDIDAPSSIQRPPALPWHPPEEPPTCESYSTWKEIAHAECEAEGLVLVNLTPLEACGEGMLTGVEAECVAPANKPDEPSGHCVGLAVGDGATCEPPENFKKIAEQACWEDGLSLVDLYPSMDCGDGLSTMAKVLCCGDVPPPEASPPQGPCITFEMAPACSPASAVEAEAKTQCAGKGLFLSDMKLAECDGGGISYAAFLCCP